MDSRLSIAIKQDFAALADKIVAAARTNSCLMQALQDYDHANERANDAQIPLEDRALWAEIRTELVAEIRRLYLAQTEDRGASTR